MAPGGGRGGRFLTEEEKANAPKVTLPLLKRIFSYLNQIHNVICVHHAYLNT